MAVAGPSSSPHRYSYHVFLSFLREDIGLTFADHLHAALRGAGIHAFRDEGDVERGENVESGLQRAIQESKISIIVFSRNHAGSSRCLDELVKIVGRRKTSGHRVLPVFFHVDPSDVRKQTGTVAEGLTRIEEEELPAEATVERRKEWEEKLGGWKAALREVADLAGMVLENQADGHEARFIGEIVGEIEKKLKRTVLHVTPYPVGIECRVKDIDSWLKDRSESPSVAVISGMGGIGKTTVAKVAYNLNFEDFEASSFLANIRETSEQPNGLIQLQKQLLSDILIGRNEKIYNPDEGVVKIQDSLCCKKILLVLDDVDHLDQLNSVIGTLDWFLPGSKILITTRHEQLLKPHEIDKNFKINELNDDESLRLFSWHAFGQENPTESFMEKSKSVIRHCSGVPLALRVLASSLSGRGTEVWGSALEKLEAILHNKIQKTLEVSYKSLQDDHDRNLFLYIASSCIGKDRDEVVKNLEEGDFFFPTVGIQNLVDRGLIAVDGENKLVMHQLVQDMGRGIMSKESGDQSTYRHHAEAGERNVRPRLGNEGEITVEESASRANIMVNGKSSRIKPSSGRAKRQHSHDNSDESRLSYQNNSLKRRILSFFPCFK